MRPMPLYYRGGPSLSPKPRDYKLDRSSNLLKPTRGVSVYNRPDHPNLTLFGGAYLVGNIPDRLWIAKTGPDPDHFEVAPALEMTLEEYCKLLDQIDLTPVGGE